MAVDSDLTGKMLREPHLMLVIIRDCWRAEYTLTRISNLQLIIHEVWPWILSLHLAKFLSNSRCRRTV